MKKFTLFLIFVGVIVGLGVFVIAQGYPSSEVSQLYMFCDGANVGTNATCSGGVSACIENDGGYNPAVQGQIAGSFISMTSFVSGQGVIPWYPDPNSAYQCVYGTEYCIDGQTLAEVTCGNNIGVTASNFGTVFPNNIWQCVGDPAALMYVNCATYATNNPSLGLAGTCSAGACI